MELRQLEYFVAVAVEGGFTAAAQRTHTTQPNISAQIRALERELGTALFHRAGRQVRLTTAGEAALPSARDTLTAAESVTRAVADVADLAAGSLSIGMVDGCTLPPLFTALGRFRDTHPGVALTLIEDASPTLIELVTAGRLDVALAGWSSDLPSGLDHRAIIREDIVAVLPRDHPFLGKSSLTSDDLRGQPLICLPPGAGIRGAFDRTLGLPVALEASSPDAVAEMARSGLGIGILSRSIADDRGDIVASRPIVGADAPAVLGFVWRRPAWAAVTAFLDFTTAAFQVAA
ncbi:LysR family transcriptional regulator [Gordonia soli]|uniref:Putative LysR family transcriptional regulator n=1 Tax=Gordonia soli NBRC 108243 TaxID=1223545 RepID=M0QEH3_9ACTN|nr:LysR family transcriptional regulator [Gordonia soli]GAC66993.1 putative LysR family transcriptional regulator [Gordonia soli NBRC 108243]